VLRRGGTAGHLGILSIRDTVIILPNGDRLRGEPIHIDTVSPLITMLANIHNDQRDDARPYARLPLGTPASPRWLTLPFASRYGLGGSATQLTRREGRAMATDSLPQEGELRLGAVMLPAGRRVVPTEGPGEPVAWVTTTPVPDAGLAWSALSDAHQQTGLVPILLTDSEKDEDYFFSGPADLAALDHLDATEVLAERWERRMPSDGEEDSDQLAAIRGPFSSEFPGLAPPEDAKLSMAQLYAALRSLPDAPIGLVPARRAADVLPTVGWCGSDQFQTPLPVAAVLRSWEARFGARLLTVGPGAQIRLLVERPPQTTEAAQAIAAEHFAFCDECAGQGLRHIPKITASLVNAPTWTFWWD